MKIHAEHPIKEKIGVQASLELGTIQEADNSYKQSFLVTSEVTMSSEDGVTSIVSAKCKFEGLFISRLPLKMATKPTLLSDMAIRICWPYNRAFLMHTLSQMGFPGILLPLLIVDDNHRMHLIDPMGHTKSSE